MLAAETIAEIRRLYYAEHWKVGTIAAQLGVHPDAIRRAVNREPGTHGRSGPGRAGSIPLCRG
jgi:IS30 family transposase